jgi:RNA polymerase sigma-70 factor (ECF subfamily)
MKRITINKAIDSYKKKYNLVPLKDDFKEETDIEVQELDFPLDEILKLVQELPNQYRLVFCLYELDDYPHHEIAKMLSISEGTSKSNLHRAKLILKEKIRSRMVQHYNIGHGK